MSADVRIAVQDPYFRQPEVDEAPATSNRLSTSTKVAVFVVGGVIFGVGTGCIASIIADRSNPQSDKGILIGVVTGVAVAALAVFSLCYCEALAMGCFKRRLRCSC